MENGICNAIGWAKFDTIVDMKTFSSTKIIGQSWGLFKERWADFYKLYVVLLLVAILSSMGTGIVTESLGQSFAIFYNLITFYISTVFSIGFVRGYLKIVRDEPLEINVLYDHYANWRLVLTFVSAQVVYGLVGALGLILLIVPGVYFLLKYMFVQMLIADQGLRFGEAFSKSAEMTEGIKMNLLGYVLLVFGLSVLGLLLLLIGSLVTTPVVTIAGGILYEQLRKKK